MPEKSLVLVSIDSGEMGSVIRVDLSRELVDRVGHLAQVAAAADPEAAIAVIIDADGAHCPMCNEEYRELCTALTDALSQHNIVLWAAHVVDRVAPGGRWHCVDGCGSGGVIDDPSASPLAVAAVLDGRRLYAPHTVMICTAWVSLSNRRLRSISSLFWAHWRRSQSRSAGSP